MSTHAISASPGSVPGLGAARIDMTVRPDFVDAPTAEACEHWRAVD